ncbi:hypothetical protein AWZ03_015134 [Drosophila navojoa]|uniref:Uncharacterized protein n=1 Tax=Drosophila navojoa TaxID=7232 RepID=A0A484APH0_DRONA|nr:hypothetical protein AWZ03_015134 [Drosophila navojoa]
MTTPTSTATATPAERVDSRRAARQVESRHNGNMLASAAAAAAVAIVLGRGKMADTMGQKSTQPASDKRAKTVRLDGLTE